MPRMDEHLRRNPIFSQAADESIAELASRSWLRRCAPDQLVLVEGEPALNIHALVQGAVRVFHMSPDGDEVTLKLFRAPALFGEAEALSGIAYLEHVAAVDSCEIVSMPTEAFLAFLDKEPRCAIRMLKDVATRLAISAYNEKSLAFHPATIRLANYLIDYTEWTNPAGTTAPALKLNQDQMAAAVGVSRRSVAKDMAAWQQEGILQRRDGHYIVLNMEALRGYCDPDRLTLTYSLSNR